MEQVTGQNEILKFLEDLPDKLFESIMEIAKDESSISRNNILTGMRNTPKSSKGIRRKNVIHFPSLPGNSPAIDRGELAKGIIISSGKSDIQFGARGVKYAQRLEDKKRLNRPFIEPEHSDLLPRLEKRFDALKVGNL